MSCELPVCRVPGSNSLKYRINPCSSNPQVTRKQRRRWEQKEEKSDVYKVSTCNQYYCTTYSLCSPSSDAERQKSETHLHKSGSGRQTRPDGSDAVEPADEEEHQTWLVAAKAILLKQICSYDWCNCRVLEDRAGRAGFWIQQALEGVYLWRPTRTRNSVR